MWEEKFGTQAGVVLIEAVCLIWRPLNTGFTITAYLGFYHKICTGCPNWLIGFHENDI